MKVCRVKGAASTFVIKKWVKKLPRLNSLLKILMSQAVKYEVLYAVN